MNYPVWQLEFLGGGFLIAVIAIIHVYIAQFAVGGGLFLVLTEHLGRRRNNQSIIDYVRKHTKFFLLLTMVFGALTGVGIWFTISLLNPSATSVLIHTFVFAWGTEWVFFVIEIVSLFIYFYTFDRLSRRNHLIIGWIYFGAAWMSLFVINGIIDFMLTPGSWVENNNFWSGFFNPTFWPALFFRTFFSVMIPAFSVSSQLPFSRMMNCAPPCCATAPNGSWYHLYSFWPPPGGTEQHCLRTLKRSSFKKCRSCKMP